MKTTWIAVVAGTVVFGVAGHAQNSVEYSTLGTAAAGHTQTVTRASDLGGAFTKVAKDVNGVQQGTASGGASSAAAHRSTRDPNAPQASIWEAPNVPGKNQAPAKPTPPAVFVLSSGDRLETADYLVTVNSVRVDQNGVQRTIPLSQLNVDATLAANKARGVNIKFPTDKSQIMLGF